MLKLFIKSHDISDGCLFFYIWVCAWLHKLVSPLKLAGKKNQPQVFFFNPSAPLIGSVDSTIRQEINLDFLEKFSKVPSFSRERGWHFQLLLGDKRSIAGSSFCVWFNHVWVFGVVVYRSLWRFRFVCFGNWGFQVSKRIHLVSFSGVNPVISPHTTIIQGFRVSGIHQQELSEYQAASLLLWLQTIIESLTVKVEE